MKQLLMALAREDEFYEWVNFYLNAEILPKIKPILHQNFFPYTEIGVELLQI